LESGDDVLVMRRSQSWTFKKTGAITAVLLSVGAVVALLGSHGTGNSVGMSEDQDMFSEKLEVAGVGGKSCSGPGKDCAMTKCCNVTGYKCYLKPSVGAVCLDGIAPGASSSPNAIVKLSPKPGDSRPSGLVMWDKSVPPPGTSLFCFELYAKDTGSKKKNYNLELMQLQYSKGASIFACDDYMVFSDVPVTLGGTVNAVVIDMPHLAKRESTGCWVNSPAFQSAWSGIKTDGRYAKYDWTIKVDQDAVFFPDRLRLKLSGQKVTEKGIYITNCEHVSFGFFGSVEVFSKSAVDSYLSAMDACKADPKINNLTYGEDLFAQKCMNTVGVANVEDFYLVTDGVCDAIAVAAAAKLKKKVVHKPDCAMGSPGFHPLKKPDDWEKCYQEALQNPR
jgi:hypothetical protein